jgi:hypothetical protein
MDGLRLNQANKARHSLQIRVQEVNQGVAQYFRLTEGILSAGLQTARKGMRTWMHIPQSLKLFF